MPRPHIVKGKGVTGALAYVMGQGTDPVTRERRELLAGQDSRAEILGGQNFGFAIENEADLELARRVMEWNALPQHQTSKTLKCEKDCLHASISWEKGAEPGKDDMIAAAQGFLKSLGMENAQAVFVAHHDTPHAHVHIVASRIDPESGLTYSQQDDQIKAQVWALCWEREHGIPAARRKAHEIFNAVEARDGAAVLDILTEHSPTFTARELDRALRYSTLSKQEVAEFSAGILAAQNVVGLREETQGPVARYTTRDILAGEMALLRGAQSLADDQSHGLGASRVAAMAERYTLKPEQADALAHLTGDSGFAVLWGNAGTGKSHTLNAVRSAYEAEGAHCIGLSWTNKVTQAMRNDGFAHAETIASELKRLENGRAQWGSKTVLIVDEAAMISTDVLARVTEAAGVAGAKLILAGDDKQLSSIERGGMFETLRQTHGAAVLKEVQRVKDAEQRQVFGEMHEGEFLGALQFAEKAGRLHWTDKQADALLNMAQAYSDAVAESPEKRRFMFAYSNAEVDALNNFARALHRERGDLGDDHALMTARGEADFAEGDRIALTGNGYTPAAKRAGYTNGRVGTITEIEIEDGKPRVTVELDTKGKAPQLVSFIVGDDRAAGEFNAIRHGYAGTIYKGQGDTLDEGFVCYSQLWRSSSSYVALTRHREAMHIFAAHETVENLEAMAQAMGRVENKRAATAYRIDDGSAMGLVFNDAARGATSAEPEPPRYADRVQAFLDAEWEQRRQQQPGPEPQAAGKAERAEPLTAEQQDREAYKKAWQELCKLFGREVPQEEGAGKSQTRDRGGGAQSL